MSTDEVDLKHARGASKKQSGGAGLGVGDPALPKGALGQAAAISRPKHRRRESVIGGEGGIRTLDTGFGPYNCLAGSPVRPLQHLSARWTLAEGERLSHPRDTGNRQFSRRVTFIARPLQ